MRCDRLWVNASLVTLAPNAAGLGVIEGGAIGAIGSRIAYVGSTADAPKLEAREVIDCCGRLVTPGLVDPHTHLIFAGDRAEEFERLLSGETYEDIARAGGGIISTVTATRLASEEELVALALPRLDALIGEGVTTVEIKSGYGLTPEDEVKSLRAARKLGTLRPITVTTTLLAAHVTPPEFAGEPDAYIDLVCRDIIPKVAAEGLADAVDAFCDRIGFTLAQTQRVFEAARAHGLPVKLHAEQLSNQGGAGLAATWRALSSDHLEYLDDAGVGALANSGVVATLLPGAFYFTRQSQRPPIAALRAAGAPMALATDCNPGTSPLTSPLLVMNLAATLFKLTVEECLAGMTREAARALGRTAEIGALDIGKRCDLAIWDVKRPAELVYRMGFNPLHARIWGAQ